MIQDNEIQVRTDEKKMLVCTAVQNENGDVELSFEAANLTEVL